MKKRMLSILLLCALPCLLPAQVKYTLKGKIGTLIAPAKIYLQYTVSEKQALDSAILQNGRFSFTGRLAYPVIARLVLRAENKIDFLSIYLGNGTININSNDATLKNGTITGSKLYKDNKRLLAALQPVKNKTAKLEEVYNRATAEQKNDTAFIAGLQKEGKAIFDERKGVYKKFIADNPGSYISLWAITTAGGFAPAYNDIAPLFYELSKELKSSPEGKKIAERLARLKTLGIGDMAPDFTQNDTSGVPVKLSSFRGKYVLVDFWASWCAPCRKENPGIVRSYNKYKDRNFTVLGVSLDQPNGKEKWLKAINDDHLYWTHVSDLASYKNAVALLYEVQAIPQNYLIDPSGKIVAKSLDGEELDKKLNELLD